MPRTSRVVIPGCPHHVTQRGNNRQDVFFADADRRRYLELLTEQAARFGVAVEGYCLMTNHVHLVVVPSSADSLAKQSVDESLRRRGRGISGRSQGDKHRRISGFVGYF